MQEAHKAVSNVDRDLEGETESGEIEQIREAASSGSKMTTTNLRHPGPQRIHLPAEALN